jgi:hypothetical protein
LKKLSEFDQWFDANWGLPLSSARWRALINRLRRLKRQIEKLEQEREDDEVVSAMYDAAKAAWALAQKEKHGHVNDTKTRRRKR